MEYAKKVKLTHGIIMAGMVGNRPAYRGAGELAAPYKITLIKPARGIKELQLRVPTLGEALVAMNEARKKHAPGTAALNYAVSRALAKTCAQPEIDDKFFDELAGVDYDEIMVVMARGTDPRTEKSAFPLLDPNGTPEGHTREAFIRLHSQSDRANAEANLRTDKHEDQLGYEVQMAYLMTSFGEVPNFDVRGDIHSFHSITWPDFNALQADVYARDYEALADIISGDMEVGDSKLPFPGVPDAPDSGGTN